MQQLITLAARKSAVPALLQELEACELCTSWTLEAVLAGCTRLGDTKSLKEVNEFAKEHQIHYTGAAHSALLQGCGTAKETASHFGAAVDQGVVNSKLLLGAAGAATLYKDAKLAQSALQHLPPKPTREVAAAVIRLVGEGPLRSNDMDKVVMDLYEKHFYGLNLLGDAHTGQRLVDLALRQQRADVLMQLMCASEGLQQHALLKTLGSQNRRGHTFGVFRACPEKTQSLCNVLLDACIVCKDVKAAEEGMANTSNSEGVWAVLVELKSSGLQLDHETCSILLKNIQQSSRARDVERSLAVVGAMDDTMDEVLLSPVCEGWIRVGRSDLLAKQLVRQSTDKRVDIRLAHTFDVTNPAHGALNDLKGVWDTWLEMQMRHITLTSIMIGCMVEAPASNGDPESAHELIHEMLADGDTSSFVIAVIYGSVLKVFSRQKQFDRVWLLYEEMRAETLAVPLSAYNALTDACARSPDMARLPELLQDMAKDGLEATLVTYSTILTGYWQENRLGKAFELRREMKRSTKYRPDEITYNTLIDGCAGHGLYVKGVLLLRDTGQMTSHTTIFSPSSRWNCTSLQWPPLACCLRGHRVSCDRLRLCRVADPAHRAIAHWALWSCPARGAPAARTSCWARSYCRAGGLSYCIPQQSSFSLVRGASCVLPPSKSKQLPRLT